MSNQEVLKHKITRDSYISICYVKNKNLLERIKNKIIEKSKDSSLDYKTNVKAKFTGFYSLAKEPEIFDFMTEIKPFINNIYTKSSYLEECWGNIYTNNDYALEHHHQNCTGFCGILYLSEGGPGTYFSDFNVTVNEEYGKVVLPDPLLLHQVVSSNLKKTRITMAFNCYEKKSWDNFYLNQEKNM